MDNNNWRTAKYIVLIVLHLCLAYTIVRYVVMRDVALAQIPMFLTNKAVSLSAVIVIGMAYSLGPLAHYFAVFRNYVSMRRELGIFGFGLATMHVIMSMPLISNLNYPKFFMPNGRFSSVGELSLMFGVVAFMILIVIALFSLPGIADRTDKKVWQKIQRFGYAAYALVALHIAVYGARAWFTAEPWRHFVAPITVISCAIILIVLVLRLSVIPANRRAAEAAHVAATKDITAADRQH